MRSFRPYLVFKVFSYFWLSIVATIVILILISSLSFIDAVDEPLSRSKIRDLQKKALFLSRINARAPTPRLLERLVHSSSKRKIIYLKGPTPEQSVSSRPLPDDVDVNLLNYVETDVPRYILTQHFHAAGPIPLMLADGEYLLYEIRLTREPPLFIKIKFLPVWVKLAVPVVMSLLFAWLFSRSIVSPIRALRDTADSIGKGKLDSRVQVHTERNDELGELIYDFNNMAQQLESLMGGQKRLLADISHELRSPLTRLSLATGLVRDCSEEKREEYLNRIDKEAGLLDEMIASVLMLSRLENQQQHLDKSLISIADLITPTLQDAEFEAQGVAKSLVVDELPMVSVEVDKKILVSAIDNIIRNAIRHAQSQVSVSVRCEHNKVLFVIKDDGPGVPDYIIEKLTEPFFRHSESRARASGGAGLGLAIAQKAMLAHGGKLQLQNGQERGLEVTMSLDIAS